jgi:hypothetical protein
MVRAELNRLVYAGVAVIIFSFPFIGHANSNILGLRSRTHGANQYDG